MKNLAYGSLVLLLACSLSVAVFALPAAGPDQPRMHAAKADLENALKSLRKATADKGGHREKAIDLASQAITAVNDGIEYDRTHYTPKGRNNSDSGEESFRPVSIMTDQPNMVDARTFLQNALVNLNKASTDKGGYRERAQTLVRNAIAEVNLGIEYDRNN